MKTQLIEEAYRIARERYAAVGVDTEEAMKKLQDVSLSLHCWQADDVIGFENRGGTLSGGIQTTGNYPGRARNVGELRADILKAVSYIPGSHRLSLHEIYGEFGGETVDLDEAVQVALDFAKKDGNTLVVVTADHAHACQIIYPKAEAPGLSLAVMTKDGAPMTVTYGNNDDPENQGHTGTQLRIAAYGPHAANVSGLTDQTDLYFTILSALGLEAKK